MAWEIEIAEAAGRHGLRPVLLAAVIEHESGGDPRAVGDGGKARGLCQMHREACEDVGADWDRLFDAEYAIDAGAQYLTRMLRAFGGNELWAVAAWNQGPGVIGRAKRYADAVMALANVPSS